MKGGDTSGNLDIKDTVAEESNANQNDESETLVAEEMPDEASSMQLIEKPARKSLSQTHKKQKGRDQVNDTFINLLIKVTNNNNKLIKAEQHFLFSLLLFCKNLSSHQEDFQNTNNVLLT